MKHLAILQRWKCDETFTLMFQAPMEKKDTCVSTLEALQKESYQKKIPVEYKMIELDGDVRLFENPNKTTSHKIIIPSGELKGMEVYIELDVKPEFI